MRMVSLAAVVLSALLLVACITKPILNVENVPVLGPTSKPLTAEQVRGAILRAGTALGWHVRDAGPNKPTATFMYTRNSAEIEIPYTAASYSLLYKSSEGLRAENGRIHKIYNQWIEILAKGTNSQLATCDHLQGCLP